MNRVSQSDLDARIAKLSPADRELLERRLEARKADALRGEIIARRPDRSTALLSFAQQRLWFLDRLEPGSNVYNVSRTIRLRGPLDAAALGEAFTALLARHESLRSRIREAETGAFVEILPPARFPLPIVDFGRISPSDWESRAMRLARAEAAEPFDLASGPLLRAKLFRRDAGHHILQLTMHHIASDGWSAEVFFRELGALYGAFSSGKPSPLSELPIQYGDFAQWQREWLRGEVLERQISYWRNQLRGAPPLDLPADRPNPVTPSSRGSVQNIQLSKELAAALRELSRSEGATLFMTLLTAFLALLSRYAAQEDIAVGTPIANRGRPELEDLIGLFVNTLVLRVDLSGDPTFRESLRRVREVALAAYAHQDLPFERLVEELHPERKLGRNPLFQVMVAFRSATLEALVLPGLTAEIVPVPMKTAKFDLSLDIVEKESSLSCDLEYSTDLYDDETIRRMLGHLESLLTVVAQDPGARLSRVALLTEPERHRLSAWNQTEREYPENVPVHRLFQRQAERTPRSTAVECGGRRWTYRLVNERANRLARHLRARGVGPEVLVGLCVERSVEMIVGMLAIMKAGGAYLPLDPTYPADRLRFMMEDSGAKWLLTDQNRLPDIESAAEKTILLGSDSEVAAAESGENLETASAPENLAYVIYTSGSTGKPKGVEITHGAIANYIRSIVERVGLEPDDRVLQFASLSFDVAAEEIFATLSVGATVVLRSEEMLETVDIFLRTCLRLRLTVLVLPTAYWHEVVAVASSKRLGFPKSVRMVIIGGEKALPERFAQWKELTSDHVRLFNAYGPTETTVSATVWEASPAAAESVRGAVPIGRPIANLRAYVLDRHLQSVPVGVGGELFIGGRGVARGYRDRPELTAQSFLPDPFRGGSARIYRTGDRARFRNDGNLEYLGRVDSQIKLRGFRVEPGEIETALREMTGVREAVVRAREDSPGQSRLIAYVVADPSDAASRVSLDLRARLRERLPAHMVPSKFVKLEALPVTPNGKIDFDALPDPDGEQLEDAYVAPRNSIEARMARIWSEVLGVEKVGVLDNFFDLGGHSLLAIQLLGRIEKELGPRLSLAAIFRSPRIADLAEVFEERRRRARTVTPSLVPIQRKGTHPPFYCVHAETGVVYYRPLARLVGADQPFYGIQSRGLDGRGRPLETVEEMAAHYVAEVRGFQPEGPYYIGGHSFGGKIAFEMARQLAAAGQRTAFLALFDTATSPSRPLSARTSMLHLVRSRARIHVRTLGRLGSREKVSYLIQRWETAQSVFSHWFARATDSLFHPLRHAQRMVREANIRAAARYVPKYYEGRVTIFRATDRGVQLIDPDLGWRELCGEGVEVHEVPGGHSSILLEDVHLQALGAKLRESLRDARETERLKSASMGRGTTAER